MEWVRERRYILRHTLRALQVAHAAGRHVSWIRHDVCVLKYR
jgi:hypothetical protein